MAKPLFQLKKNKAAGHCSVKYCSNKAVGSLCSTCRSRKTRMADPVRYAFNNLRNRAKQRGILFTITLEQFRQWCHKVKYVGLPGRSAESYTVDRIHNDLGYHADNIQLMTRRDNVKKYFTYDWREKTVREMKMTTIDSTEDPF